jgi:hypothetical protein
MPFRLADGMTLHDDGTIAGRHRRRSSSVTFSARIKAVVRQVHEPRGQPLVQHVAEALLQRLRLVAPALGLIQPVADGWRCRTVSAPR